RCGWRDLLWLKSGNQNHDNPSSRSSSTQEVSSPSTNRYRFSQRSRWPLSFAVLLLSSTPCQAWSSHQAILHCMEIQ
ncbi:hypothetical protein PFISCL1PPCAC_12408, partial [Pristionchus fissidentatus]